MRFVRKVIGTLLLITALLVTQIPVVHTSAASSSDFQMDKTKLVKYTGTASSVSVPSTVKTIGAEAFAGNTSLTSVSIGSNVTEIEYGAFKDCTSLNSVKLPDSLISIGNSVFSNNTSLKKITLPKQLKELGSGVFAGCKNLTAIEVDKDNAGFTFYKNGLYDKEKTKLYCYTQGSRDTKYTMPNTVIDIDEYAFWDNDHLKEISFSTNLSEIPSYAFSNCRNLLAVSIPYSVRSIQSKAFENCISLQKVTIPASVSYIHSTAFDGCPKLVISSDSGSAAHEFYENWKLVNHTDVVSGSENGDTVVDSEGNVYLVGSDGNLILTEKNENNSGYQGSYDALHDPSNVDYTPEYDPVQGTEEGVLGKTMIVGSHAVLMMDSNVQVVTTLNNRDVFEEEETPGNGALVDDGSKGDALPKYAIVYDHITDFAYYGDNSFTTYTIPSVITQIGDFAFARSSLTSIHIPKGVTKIGYAAFYHCDALKEISIPSTVTWIEPSAFSYTAWLNAWAGNSAADDFLIVGDGILLAYKGSSKYVEIPDNVKVIAPACFLKHTEIADVTIPSSVTVIGEEAFKDCSALQKVHGGSGVIEIQDRAFENTDLTQITISETVKKVGIGAFCCNTDREKERIITFQGDVLPKISYTDRTSNLSNQLLVPVFAGNWTAILNHRDFDLKHSILGNKTYGFEGKLAVKDSEGKVNVFSTVVLDTASKNEVMVTCQDEEWKEDDISVSFLTAGNYHLKISKSSHTEEIQGAFWRVYGKKVPEMKVFDMTLWEDTETIEISDLGRNSMVVTVPLPTQIEGSKVHAVTLDDDGQLEKLSCQLIQKDDKVYVTFSTNHFSPFAIYAMGEDGTLQVSGNEAELTSLSGQKDYSPNTGDGSIHPKWFLAIGISAIGIAVIAYKPSKRRKY